LVAYTLRISVEEKALFQSLGEEYRRYAERTKRLVPGIF
jgi:protein-S-isoprenylcysteine O-methyltransferase Ste14